MQLIYLSQLVFFETFKASQAIPPRELCGLGSSKHVSL